MSTPPNCSREARTWNTAHAAVLVWIGAILLAPTPAGAQPSGLPTSSA